MGAGDMEHQLFGQAGEAGHHAGLCQLRSSVFQPGMPRFLGPRLRINVSTQCFEDLQICIQGGMLENTPVVRIRLLYAHRYGQFFNNLFV